MTAYTVLTRDHRLTDRDIREWVTDAAPTLHLREVARDAARVASSTPGAKVTLARGVRSAELALEPAWTVSSWTDDVREAGMWGPFVVTSDIDLVRILAVVHYPGLGVTEYVGASGATPSA